MEKVIKQVEVMKEADELAQALVSIVKAVKAALKDGFQPGADLPAIIVSAVATLPAALDGVQKLPEESKSDPVAFAQAFVLAAGEITAVALKKEV
jgi:hypothetical protein